MKTESQVCNRDLLKDFCEEYISRNAERWPTDETELASSFIKHFNIPFLVQVSTLKVFAAQTGIELVESDIPGNLLGVNMSFERKRHISFSGRVEHAPFSVHTILHEIRELIESEFCRLGFDTSSGDLETRADQFAFAAFISSGAPVLGEWFEKALEMDSKWLKLATVLGLIGVAATLVSHSFAGALYPRFSGDPHSQ